jgi:hypothetical protein
MSVTEQMVDDGDQAACPGCDQDIWYDAWAEAWFHANGMVRCAT